MEIPKERAVQPRGTEDRTSALDLDPLKRKGFPIICGCDLSANPLVYAVQVHFFAQDVSAQNTILCLHGVCHGNRQMITCTFIFHHTRWSSGCGDASVE